MGIHSHPHRLLRRLTTEDAEDATREIAEKSPRTRALTIPAGLPGASTGCNAQTVGRENTRENRVFMTTHVAAVRVPTPNSEAAQNAQSEGAAACRTRNAVSPLTLSNFEGPWIFC